MQRTIYKTCKAALKRSKEAWHKGCQIVGTSAASLQGTNQLGMTGVLPVVSLDRSCTFQNIDPPWSNRIRRADQKLGRPRLLWTWKKNNSENTDNRNSQVVLGCDPCPQLQRTASTRSCRDIENSCSSSGYVWLILISYMMSWVISLMQIPAGCKIDC